MAKARVRATFHDSLGRFASPKSKGVRVWKSGRRVTGKGRAREIRQAGPGKSVPSRNISAGFPRGYASPFRAFILPVSDARVPERAFALVEIISRRLYEGTAYTNWVPFALGYMPPARGRKLTEKFTREQFKMSNLAGRNSLGKIFGFYMLKSEEERREALTPRLMRLIRYRAQHGNENVKALPERPKKKGRSGKRGKRKRGRA